MQVSRKRAISHIIIATLVVFGVYLFGHFSFSNTKTLRVSFLNVGEGSSVLIQSPSGVSVLIDGGPDRSVLRYLGKRLGPLNRTIDMVIETDTKAADISGLVSVFNRYNVKSFVSSSVSNNTLASRMVAASVAHDKNIVHVNARNDMRFMIGDGAYIEVLSSGLGGSYKKPKPLVLRLVYGDTSFIFPSYSSSKTQNKMSTTIGKSLLNSSVLSVGGYGAVGSIDATWLEAVRPDFAVISVGKNRYGYPSKSTVSLLSGSRIKVLTTSKNGTITFTSDGVGVRRMQ